MTNFKKEAKKCCYMFGDAIMEAGDLAPHVKSGIVHYNVLCYTYLA